MQFNLRFLGTKSPGSLFYTSTLRARMLKSVLSGTVRPVCPHECARPAILAADTHHGDGTNTSAESLGSGETRCVRHVHAGWDVLRTHDSTCAGNPSRSVRRSTHIWPHTPQGMRDKSPRVTPWHVIRSPEPARDLAHDGLSGGLDWPRLRPEKVRVTVRPTR